MVMHDALAAGRIVDFEYPYNGVVDHHLVMRGVHFRGILREDCSRNSDHQGADGDDGRALHDLPPTLIFDGLGAGGVCVLEDVASSAVYTAPARETSDRSA